MMPALVKLQARSLQALTMQSSSIESSIRAAIATEAAEQERTAVTEAESALHLLKAAVIRLSNHRRIHGQIIENPADIDYLLVDSTLRSCEELMRL